MSPRVTVHPAVATETHIALDVMEEDLPIILEHAGVDPRITSFEAVIMGDYEASAGLIVDLIGPSAAAERVLVELVTLDAPVGNRVQLSLFDVEGFQTRLCRPPDVPTLDVDVSIDVEWRLAWQTTAPDVWITARANEEADAPALEAALLKVAFDAEKHERVSGIKHLAARKDSDGLIVLHLDGVSSTDEVAAIIEAIDTVADTFGITSIAVGE